MQPVMETLGALYANMENVSPATRKLVERYISGDGVIVGWGFCRNGELGTNFRYNLVTPMMIGGHDKPIRMACGGLSSVWLGVRNILMAMGGGMWGELGVGNPRFCPRVIANEANMPICPGQVDVIPFTQDDVVVDVAAGSAFYACVSLKGNVFTWGANNCGQCHQDLNNTCCGYGQLRVVPGESVVEVACSNYSVLARTISGAVYGWGEVTLLGDRDTVAEKLAAAGLELVQSPQSESRVVARVPVRIDSLDDKNIKLLSSGPWHYAAVSADGSVYTWGIGNSGRLGHGDQDDHLSPEVVTAMKGKCVVDVACGSFHTVFIADDGNAYACGDNQGGQCGVVGEYSVPVPTKMNITGGRKVIHASCGRMHTTLLLNNGDVVVYGTGLGLGVGIGYGMRMVRCQAILENYTTLWTKSGPTHGLSLTIPKNTTMLVLGVPHRGVPVSVTSVGLKEGILSCGVGAGFTLMISRRGSCYSFGVGGWGQLGFDTAQAKHFTQDRVPVYPQATRIGFFSRTIITSVAAGFSFSMAITEGERVFAWGNNSFAQCGLGVDPKKYQRISQPREITWLADKEIIQVSCGSYFALALSASGQVYSWGTIECCGVGLEPDPKVVPAHMIMRNISGETRGVVLSPLLIDSLKGIIQVAAGGWHGMALNAIGEIYAWGIGTGGRLGTGDCEHYYTPIRITHGAFFTRIGCGCYTSYGIDDNARLYVWGVNDKNQLDTLGSKVVTPTPVLENVREACLGKYFSLALTHNNTFHFSGVMEFDSTSYASRSFNDVDSLPEKLKPENIQAEHLRGLKLFGGLEHVIALLEKDPIPEAVVTEAIVGMREQPERLVRKYAAQVR
ncbi:hypothetical protein, conserved [Leishmania donovani]|uniref:Regulator of chromosome condensation (RCC1) repeat family protein n=1 Tax=Leishmania donovani TaxID=5661 RepID=A0A3S7WZR9_LEIDO|nr:hypothetical protein, conserved [Leishmania donovani]AYU79673.1 Regulator of chromosome condensation (RCC1) repeat, putative [Leishmania donovani]TPP41114.1 Regulator of chromosome condensation (RCC1) repeat family protein [Leishmania donovani]CBZ34960.1 hypothetical protein, conserved [Leishmania donovani]